MTYLKQGLYSPEFEHDNCGAGFICSLNGEKTNKIIHDALEIIIKLEHRGAVSADGKTGDGAGILIDIPHEFFKKECSFDLPEPGEYAVGMLFLPNSVNQSKYCIDILESEIKRQGLNILGWRNVPVDSKHLGEIAKRTEPKVKQIFVGKAHSEQADPTFMAKVYAARKIAENKIYQSKLKESKLFYIPSFSTTTLIYKGLLIPEDIRNYYLDLSNPTLVTKLALVHQRFSTNTAPSWDLAQPFRFMCHNGEINTLRGNVSRMRARQELMENEVFGEFTEGLFPIIIEGKSDSASMDMVVELLLMTGRTLLGHTPAKGQQLDDHYFGSIPLRAMNFMRDLEQESMLLGIPVKTRHNEVAPNQFELAPIFEEVNLAVDHNSLLMDVMGKIARRHHFKVLFHEKPFDGINGSGKHNNWSLSTSDGTNLLSPGKTPMKNLQFLTFFVNTIKAVYENEELLRASIASASNDYRLGANEAPPAIMSVFIGTQLSNVLDELENETIGKLS